MNKKIALSHSTLKMLYEHPHCWINKTMGLIVPENEYFKRGHRLQKVITDYLTGKVEDERLKHIEYRFPIVEEVGFDSRCKIHFPINDKYDMIGYFDGVDHENNRTLEIKTSTKMWSLGEFNKSMQRRIYDIALPKIKENILITAVADENNWLNEKPKVFSIPVSKKDLDECWEWIMGGIKILESGEFTGDLVDGKCIDRFCLYGQNCFFKS